MARYIDADAATELARLTYCKGCNSYNGVMCRACAFDDAISFIDDFPDADVVPRNENKWILCKDRMPKDMETVLVWFEYFRYGNHNNLYQTYGLSYAFRGNWSGFINGSSGYRGLKIFAWQPLPDKPIIE